MDKIEVYSHAKINLTLDVLSKRPDGYHNVLMIMQEIALKDKLVISKIKAKSHTVLCNLDTVPADDSNLVIKAAHAFCRHFHISEFVAIEIKKTIPVGAGLGGGSGNAAVTLLALNRLFGTNASLAELKKLTVGLGADVTFFLEGGTQSAAGIGQDLARLPGCPSMHVLIVKPSFGISTKLIFDSLRLDEVQERPAYESMVDAIRAGDKKGIGALLSNVLEQTVMSRFPEIGRIKTLLYETDCLGALLCGSGSSVFALYSSAKSAESAYDFMKNEMGFDVHVTKTM